MKLSSEKGELNDIEQIKKFIIELGFICISNPSAQHLIFSKIMKKVKL